jgi:hypothetical protein
LNHAGAGQKVTVYTAFKLLEHVQRAVPLDSSNAYAYASGQLFSVGRIKASATSQSPKRQDALK